MLCQFIDTFPFAIIASLILQIEAFQIGGKFQHNQSAADKVLFVDAPLDIGGFHVDERFRAWGNYNVEIEDCVASLGVRD